MPLRKHINSITSTSLVCALIFIASVTYTFPLWDGPRNSDVMVHTRYAYEYFLALREGQWPPLVAPMINHAARIPLFQYYCADGYIIPALLIAVGFAPYRAIILNLILCCFAGSLALYAAIKSFGASRIAALILALLFLFYPKTIGILYENGMYCEWVAITTLPIVLWALLGLITTSMAVRRYKVRLMIATLLVAYYIPIHPIHAVFSLNLIVLLACAHAYAKNCVNRIPYILLCVFLGGLISAWYWLPIAQLRPFTLRIMHCCWTLSVADITLKNMFFVSNSEVFTPPVGWYFLAISLSTFVFKRRFDIGMVGSILFVAVVFIVTQARFYPSIYYWVSWIFSFAQWDNRLLIPLGLIGSVVAADYLVLLQHRGYRRLYLLVLVSLGLCATYWTCWVASIRHAPNAEVQKHITDENLFLFNTDYYRLIGVDFANSLKLLDGDIGPDYYTMETSGDFIFDYLLTLKIHVNDEDSQELIQYMFYSKRFGYCPVDIVVKTSVIPQMCLYSGEGEYILSAVIGQTNNSFSLIQNMQSTMSVKDLWLRVITDGPDKEFRVLPSNLLIRSQSPGGVSISTYIPRGKGGLYQLPIAYWPGLSIMVNGKPAVQQSSDLYKVVTALPEGKNVITLTNRWSLAKTVSVTGVLLCIGVLTMNLEWVEHKIKAFLLIMSLRGMNCTNAWPLVTSGRSIARKKLRVLYTFALAFVSELSVRIMRLCASLDWYVSAIYIVTVLFYKLILRLRFNEYFPSAHVLPADVLQNDLLRSVFYMHMQPPLMSILMGLMLKMRWNLLWLHLGLNIALGFAAVHFLNNAFWLVGIRRSLRKVMMSWLCLIPTFMLYANWGSSSPYLDFCFCCTLLYYLARIQSDAHIKFGHSFGLFMSCSLLGLMRPQWNLGFFVGLFVIVLVFKRHATGMKNYILGWCLAISPLLLVYLKNLVLFGFFGASSWLGCNLLQVTSTMGVPLPDIRRLVQTGEVSPFFEVQWSPRKMELIARDWQSKGYVMPQVSHESFKHDHNMLAEIPGCKQTLMDSLAVIRHYPFYYINRVFSRMKAIFFIPSFNYIYCNLGMIGIDYGKLPPLIKDWVSKSCLGMYAVTPALAFLFALLPQGFIRQQRALIVSVFFLAGIMLLTSFMLNGEEQERLRWAQEPFYLAFFAIVLEATIRVGEKIKTLR